MVSNDLVIRRKKIKSEISYLQNIPELEEFYTFLYENSLRREAAMIFKAAIGLIEKNDKKRKKRARIKKYH